MYFKNIDELKGRSFLDSNVREIIESYTLQHDLVELIHKEGTIITVVGWHVDDESGVRSIADILEYHLEQNVFDKIMSMNRFNLEEDGCYRQKAEKSLTLCREAMREISDAIVSFHNKELVQRRLTYALDFIIRAQSHLEEVRENARLQRSN